MDKIDNDINKKMCVLLQIQYLKKNNQTVDDYYNGDLFPGSWYLDNRYALKCEILMEALSKNIKIIETEKFELFHSCFKK